jgi:hypothetical protein
MTKFNKTLAVLAEHHEAHHQQVLLIRQFKGALEDIAQGRPIPTWMKFVVDFQCHRPGHHPIRVVAGALSAAYDKAAVLWEDRNDQSEHSNRPPADVFVSINGNLLPLSAEDAATIAQMETGLDYSPGQFEDDPRLIEKAGRIIWPDGRGLPGQRASEPTEEKEAEVAGGPS